MEKEIRKEGVFMVKHTWLHRLLIISLAFIVLAFLFWGYTQKTPDLQKCRFITSVNSPNQAYRINAYLYEPALSADCLICEVESLKSDEKKLKRILYYAFHENEANIEWISNESVRINGRELNIFYDEYNWKKDSYESGDSSQLKPIAFYEMEQTVPCSAVSINGDQRLSFTWGKDKYIELKPEWLHGNNDVVVVIDNSKLTRENAKLNCCFEKETTAMADTFYYGNYTLFEISSASGVKLLTDGMICYCQQDDLSTTESFYEELNNYSKYKVYFQSEDGSEKESWRDNTKPFREKLGRLKEFEKPACEEIENEDEYDEYCIETTSKDMIYRIEIELIRNQEGWYVERGTSDEETVYYVRLSEDMDIYLDNNL